jgi:chitin-binding protein
MLAAVGATALAATGLIVLSSAPAQAHGNVYDVPERGFRCLAQYGTNHVSTAYKDSDPMCWNGFNGSSANVFWGWNAHLRDGLGDGYKSKIADGTLCSAGATGTYDYLDTPGNWIPTTKPAKFTLNLYDQAAHNANWLDVYISKDGFDPTTQKLGWGDLALVGHTDANTGTGTKPASGQFAFIDDSNLAAGKAYPVTVDASAYTGRRLLFTVWRASHADQLYFLCSDVVIGGSGGGSTTTTTTRPTTTTTTTTTSRPATTTTTTTRGGGTTTTTTRPATTTTTTRPVTTTTGGGASGTCSVALDLSNTWSTGYVAQAKVTANSAVSSWKVTVTLPSGATATSSWSATQTGTSGTVSFANASYNGSLAAGGSTTFGFQGTGSPVGATATCS